MTLGSLFDGSGACPLAATLCGITPVWASEIEPYPIAVTTARFPRMLHLGDITKIDGGKIPPVDIVTFGSPCQDLSVAGKRAGLKGEKSSLFHEAIRIIGEMRYATDNNHPRYILWENVPGAFSSHSGEDFLQVLQEILALRGHTDTVSRPANGRWLAAGAILGDGFSVAWRTLDAQYWGVPQRRKRIYLVADFAGERAREVLFDREGLRRDLAAGGEAREGTAADAVGGAGGGGGIGGTGGIKCLTAWDQESARVYDADGIAPTLEARSQSGMNRQAVIYPEIAGTLSARHDSSPCVDRGMNFIAAYDEAQITNPDNGNNPANGGPCHTLNTEGRSIFVTGTQVYGVHQNGDGECRVGEVSNTLNTNSNASGRNAPLVIAIQGNCIDRPDTARCNGKGWAEDIGYTLNTIDRPAVAYDNQQGEENDAGDALLFPDIAGALSATTSRMAQTGVRCNAVVFGNRKYDEYEESEIGSTIRARSARDATDLCVMASGEVDRRETAAPEAKRKGGETRRGKAVTGEEANAEISHDVSPTLNCDHEQPIAAYDCRGYGDGVTMPTLTGDHAERANDYCGVLVGKGRKRRFILRRLMPLECCRLQGFPDWWMDGVEGSDSAKYRMWGMGWRCRACCL